MLSIVVLMYNEERYIVEAMESIKHQITMFGKNEEIQLILTDDSSNDRTVQIVDLWVKENEELFADVVKLYSDSNQGTCRKYGEAMRAVKGEQVVVLAGDDLFSAYNLFEKMKDCKNVDVALNAVLCFDEGGMIMQPENYSNIVLQALVTNKSIQWESKLGSPVLNGAVLRKELMTESVLQYMEMFKLVDDRPRVYKLVKDNPQLSISYDNVPILMSRRHNTSVSNLNSPHLKVHNDDLKKMYTDMLQDEKNLFMRFALKSQLANVRYRGQNGLKAKMRYVSPYYVMLGMKMFLGARKMGQLKKNLLEKYVDVNREHLLSMQKCADEFYEAHNIVWDK